MRRNPRLGRNTTCPSYPHPSIEKCFLSTFMIESSHDHFARLEFILNDVVSRVGRGSHTSFRKPSTSSAESTLVTLCCFCLVAIDVIGCFKSSRLPISLKPFLPPTFNKRTRLWRSDLSANCEILWRSYPSTKRYDEWCQGQFSGNFAARKTGHIYAGAHKMHSMHKMWHQHRPDTFIIRCLLASFISLLTNSAAWWIDLIRTTNLLSGRFQSSSHTFANLRVGINYLFG